MKENPLYASRDIKDISSEVINKWKDKLDSEDLAKIRADIILACYESKMQGVDECMQILDGTLNANTKKHLTSKEHELIQQILSNLRLMMSWRREMAIKTFEKD